MTVLPILEIIGLQIQVLWKHEYIFLEHPVVILLFCLSDRPMAAIYAAAGRSATWSTAPDNFSKNPTANSTTLSANVQANRRVSLMNEAHDFVEESLVVARPSAEPDAENDVAVTYTVSAAS